MLLTVAICTWNRAESLRTTLESIAAAAAPLAPWEVLIVNNNSTDHTREMLQSFTSRLPLREVLETRQGLSHARNAAVAQAGGRYIVWTDDDVSVGQGWLRAYESAMSRWPEASVFGGPIHPAFEGSPPAWLTEGWLLIADAFAHRDIAPTCVALVPGENLPYGANYAVRTDVQRQHRYDPDLGRTGKAGALGEEVSVLEALLKGSSGWWIPEAKVQHRIPVARQPLAYVGEFYRMVGKTHAMLAGPVATPMFLGLRRWALARFLREGLAFVGTRLSGSPVGTWLPHFRQANVALGSMKPSARRETG